jgi:hypothetical protein
MKKFLIASILFLASALAFGQDGRTKVNFYNQTDVNLRFMLNGNPVCTGDVIPGGFCTEPVYPGSYTASATDGQRSTSGRSFDIADGETYNYSVSLQDSSYMHVPAGLKLVSDLDYHKGFSVNAPVELTTDGPKSLTTDAGKPFTITTFSASLPNDDTYMVAVSEYNFATVPEDLTRVTNGFVGNGTVVKQTSATISGQPALATIVDKQVGGRTMRVALVVIVKGNKGYMFAFGTWVDSQGTNMDDVKTFFTSIRIQ